MKPFLFIISIIGALSSGYFLVTQFNSINTFGEWLVVAMLTMLFFLSIVGIFLTMGWIREFKNRVRFR